MGDTATIAYCGPAAVPGDLLTRWNFDPLLMAALAALAIVIASGRVANARAGWASLVLARSSSSRRSARCLRRYSPQGCCTMCY